MTITDCPRLMDKYTFDDIIKVDILKIIREVNKYITGYRMYYSMLWYTKNSGESRVNDE
jgi:hypothetical protein